ncbi:MAG: amidohydrolase family protein, partial [Oscillospiraceae bacterium]|nr:amidohydrolase family protein [Oscillospiraceae bacterium]
MGTDGAASNNALNMFRDLSFLTLIHKGRLENAVAVSAAEGLKIATENGAKALGLEKVGAIRPGWKADISLLRLDSPTLTPENNLVSALAYSANGSEVDMVIINGKTIYEHGEFKTIDAEKVIWNVRKTVERFQ